ncbi:MAG: hypothetical protein HQL80_05145 [Magnetococcales bacterium]|nr:hypothetical protein [Magnetococcales bacterium]
MTPSDVLSICTQNGFVLVADGTKLFLDGDLTKMTDDLAASIREHKVGLLDLLRQLEATGQATTLAAPDTHQATDLDDDDFSERAAIVEFCGGVPRQWAEGLATICTMPRPSDFTPRQWTAIVNAAGAFADRWAVTAAKVGWTTGEVFGIHSINPKGRFDRMGLLMRLADPGKTLVQLTSDAAIFEAGRARARQTLHRDTIFSDEQRLLWGQKNG